MSIYAKDFSANYLAFKEFGHQFWSAGKPVIIMTDGKSISGFLQTKRTPLPLWNACDFLLQFNFTNAHIPGQKNSAADFLFTLEKDPNEKIILKYSEDIPSKPIEMNDKSTDIAAEEPVFLIPQTYMRLEKKMWERKEETQSATATGPPVIRMSWYFANDLQQHTLNVNIAQSAKLSRILGEQKSDPTLLKFNRELLGVPIDEQI